jgi:glycosyltransferase 2 family protein
MTVPSTKTKVQNTKSRFQQWWRPFSIVFAIALIAIILQNISLESVLNSLVTLDLRLLLIAFGLNGLVYFLMAFRWRILYNTVVEPPSYLLLVKVTLVSVFFNTILPSIVGGDAYRTLQLSKYSDKESELEHSFSIVFIDRIVGLVALMILGCIGIVFNTTDTIPTIVSVITILSLIALIVILNMSMNYSAYQFLLTCFRWLPVKYFRWLESLLDRIYTNISIYRNYKIFLAQALIVSLILRFSWLVGGYYVSQSLYLDLTLMHLITFLPVVEIIRMIPITIQGIGVREGLFIVFLGTVGITSTDAVLLATLIYMIPSLIGILGGGIYLFDTLYNAFIRQNST